MPNTIKIEKISKGQEGKFAENYSRIKKNHAYSAMDCEDTAEIGQARICKGH